MREIKFRAWSFHNKEMYQDNSPEPTPYHFQIYGNGNIGYCPTFQSDDLMSFFTDTEPEDFKMKIAVMQFTGLKDKNGKEIYEGDIVKMRYWLRYGHVDIVVKIDFHSGAFWFGGGGYTDCCWFHYNAEDREIIGNVYENPDLLNSEQNPERSVATDAK